jgi:hypothetical protein
MLTDGFAFVSKISSKFLHEVAPVALASVVGTVLVNHYARQPPPVVVQAKPPANAEEVLKTLRDEQELIAEFLKRDGAAAPTASGQAEALKPTLAALAADDWPTPPRRPAAARKAAPRPAQKAAAEKKAAASDATIAPAVETAAALAIEPATTPAVETPPPDEPYVTVAVPRPGRLAVTLIRDAVAGASRLPLAGFVEHPFGDRPPAPTGPEAQ